KVCGAARIIVGVDALGEKVKVSGWEKDSGVLVKELNQRLQDFGVQEIIFTEISRDGALSGPAVDALFKVIAETKMNVIASGGVSELADIETLKVFSDDEPRLTGVIVGKALYEGKVSLEDAVKRVRS
ncbi:MAG: 1-(5-phosphoribosyl)-5-[(5-phosphoribosylamino)methylideneamino]imidazole-4-carboxamide isomerase, partial [Spirochaetia bacterium]|nr:1-(5-phosphoribosyl)-5-[(5-phosphoribosylamino)methylideneamino]imidazole-4-carboxamide isomerase [Spirochaetia bacterium]